MKKIFLGMHRPDWSTYAAKAAGAYVSCSCGQILQTADQVRAHWQLGHGDEVVSRDAAEPSVVEEMEPLIYELGRLMGAPGLAGDNPIVSPLGTLRWIVFNATKAEHAEYWNKMRGYPSS